MPVSKVDDVKVRIDRKKTTQGFAHDALTGWLTWTVEVAPGGESRVELGYSIALPDDWKL